VSTANRSRRQRNRDARTAAADDALRRARRQRITLAIVGLGLALVVAVALVTLARDDDGGGSASSATSTSAATTTTIPSVKGKPCVAVKGPYPKDTPQVPVDVGPPPKQLIIRDLVQGTGPAVPPGATTVSMHYVLVACSSGKIVESSFEGGEPLTIPLDQVIPGWTQGIPGMKVGGVRLLGIPPALGYGPIGQGADIPPGETLWFVVKLTKVQNATTSAT
jgi:peptidylprolyl isomerase